MTARDFISRTLEFESAFFAPFSPEIPEQRISRKKRCKHFEGEVSPAQRVLWPTAFPVRVKVRGETE